MKHPIPWLAGSLLLLSSCGQQASPTPDPTTPLYQLDFRITSPGDAGATLHTTRPPGTLNAQALENVPDVTFAPRPTAVSTFITRKNGVDIRHVHSTFAITNNGPDTLRNLVFLPVIRTDNDTNPANNTQTPTVPGTPFLNVRLFDGTDASTQATGIQTTQAQDVDVTTGQAVPNTAASPYLTGLDTSKVSVTVGPGLTGTVMNRGWLASPSLAAGATTNVTFAVDIPVNPSAPATQPFTFSLLFTGAQDINGSGVGAASDPNHIQGIIQGWTFGAGHTLHITFPEINDSRFGPVGDIAKDGTIDADLRNGSLYTQKLIGYCTFTGSQSAPDVEFSRPTFQAFSSGGDSLGIVQEATEDGQPVYRYFSLSEAQFNGTLNGCASFTNTVRVKLVQGWNTMTVATVNGKRQLQNLEPGARTVLTFTRQVQAVGVNVKDPYSYFTIYANQTSLSKEVTFTQNGGISGQVTLETNVPGVVVSPASITLPSLGAASVKLGAQALTTTLNFSADDTAKNYTGFLNLIVKKNGVEVGRGNVGSGQVIVPGISASVNYPYSQVYPVNTLAIGETRAVPVTVYSQNNYAGTTTLTLTGLPAGVTASTENVTLTAGGSTTVNIQVTAGAAATPADITGTLSSPKLDSSGYSYGQTAYLRVVPARINLGLNSVSGIAPARGGAWVINSAYGSPLTLIRLQGLQIVQTETISPTYSTPALIPTVDGSVVVLRSDSGGSNDLVTFVRPDGSRVDYTYTRGTLPYNQQGTVIADANNDLWFISNRKLFRLRASTGDIVLVDGTTIYPLNYAMSISPNGNTISIIEQYSSSGLAYQIDIQTEAVAKINYSTSFSPYFSSQDYATDNSGNIYGIGITNYVNGYGNGGNILKISPNGTTALIPVDPTFLLLRIYGIDRTDNNILWLQMGGSIVNKYNLTTQSLTPADIQTNSFAAIDLNGGLWEITSDQSYSGGNSTSTFYASYLK